MNLKYKGNAMNIKDDIETLRNKSKAITYATSGDSDPILNRSASIGLRLDDCL